MDLIYVCKVSLFTEHHGYSREHGVIPPVDHSTLFISTPPLYMRMNNILVSNRYIIGRLHHNHHKSVRSDFSVDSHSELYPAGEAWVVTSRVTWTACSFTRSTPINPWIVYQRALVRIIRLLPFRTLEWNLLKQLKNQGDIMLTVPGRTQTRI